MKEPEMVRIGQWISKVLANREDEACLAAVKGEVRDLCERFPFYKRRLED
jgi:glycine hydroxymethyltransferase